LNAAD
jgi:hypothetical protein